MILRNESENIMNYSCEQHGSFTEKGNNYKGRKTVTSHDRQRSEEIRDIKEVLIDFNIYCAQKYSFITLWLRCCRIFTFIEKKVFRLPSLLKTILHQPTISLKYDKMSVLLKLRFVIFRMKSFFFRYTFFWIRKIAWCLNVFFFIYSFKNDFSCLIILDR